AIVLTEVEDESIDRPSLRARSSLRVERRESLTRPLPPQQRVRFCRQPDRALGERGSRTVAELRAACYLLRPRASGRTDVARAVRPRVGGKRRSRRGAASPLPPGTLRQIPSRHTSLPGAAPRIEQAKPG